MPPGSLPGRVAVWRKTAVERLPDPAHSWRNPARPPGLRRFASGYFRTPQNVPTGAYSVAPNVIAASHSQGLVFWPIASYFMSLFLS